MTYPLADSPRRPPPSRRPAAAALALALGLGLALGTAALAQSGKEDRREPPRPPGKEVPKKDQARPESPAPAPEAKPGVGAEAAQPPAKIQPKLPQTAAEKAKLLGDLYAQLAAAESEEEAKKFSGQIERLWVQSGSDTVSLLLDRAAKEAKAKKPELAKKLYDSAISLAPDYAEAFNQRAYFHFTENNFDAAVGDLRRVIALDPNHFKALEGLAQIWRETGNKKGAFGVMKRLLDVHPYAAGAKQSYEDLKREVDGQGI